MYITAINEIERQISVQCNERGSLLRQIFEGYEEINEFCYKRHKFDLTQQRENHAKEMSESRMIFAKQLAFAQVKIESLEKEKNELIHKNGLLMNNIKEQGRLIDELKKNDKPNIRLGVKFNTFKQTLKNVEENKENFENNETFQPISEKLVKDLQKKLETLQELKKSIKIKKEELNDLEIEINDNKCDLSTINFEIELKQTLAYPIAKYTPKAFFSITGPKSKKSFGFPIVKIEESETYSKFFKNLSEKSKSKLVSKGKVSQDHIFQSISVIYHRAIVQVNLVSEVPDFQCLIYKQFCKNENRSKGEKALKVFIGGCLKFSEFRRVSVFLRFLQLGEFVNKPNFS